MVPSLGQAQILSRARAFSDPLSMPSGTGASTPFDSETEFDTELESQHTCVSEESGPTRLSDHDLRNRYFRRDTIVLSHFDVFRCVFFVRDEDSRVILPSPFKSTRFHASPRNGISIINYSPSHAYIHERGAALWSRTFLDYLPHALSRSRPTCTEHTQIPCSTLLKALSLPSR